MSTVAITGNTYPVKDQIKALGGRWNADRKAWMVPANQAAQAQALVSRAPKQVYSLNSGSRRGFSGGAAAPVRGYSSWCTGRDDCRCYDCAS